jgi:hypothetical protein
MFKARSRSEVVQMNVKGSDQEGSCVPYFRL